MTAPLLVGHCLNVSGSRRVAHGLAVHDAKFISALACRQIGAGADALDLCAAGADDEPAALQWLLEIVQAAVDVPLWLDSRNPEAFEQALPLCRRPPILNAYSGVLPRPDLFRDLCHDWPLGGVVALCLDARGPQTIAAERAKIASRLADDLTSWGIPQEKILFDPVTLPLGTAPGAHGVTLETMTRLRSLFPASRILCAVGNAGYGLPDRRTAERNAARAARSAGADAFLFDPLKPDLVDVLFS